jgi:hypothetical protein
MSLNMIEMLGEPALTGLEEKGDPADALDCIASQVQRWIDYDRADRDKEGLITEPGTHIMCPPTWPSHGQLGNWVAALNRARDILKHYSTAQAANKPRPPI